jgi:hypothetical protein
VVVFVKVVVRFVEVVVVAVVVVVVFVVVMDVGVLGEMEIVLISPNSGRVGGSIWEGGDDDDL